MFRDPLCLIPDPHWVADGSALPASCLDYNGDGDRVAFSNRTGELVLQNIATGVVIDRFNQGQPASPFTGCCFHPFTQNLVLVCSFDGRITLYNYETSETINTSRNLGSHFLTMAIDSFGDTFAISGGDGSIRIHQVSDLVRTKALVKLSGRGSSASTTYALKYHPIDANVILSASANRVTIWDLRTGNSERGLVGPHIRGAGLAIHGNTVYTASFRDAKQIEVWDYTSLKKLKDINFDLPGTKPSPLNTISVSRNGLHVVAGGTGSQCAQVFDTGNGSLIGSTKSLGSPIVATAMSPYGTSFLVGTEAGNVSCFLIRVKQ
jgi:WD40 repeat protein